MSRAIPVVIIVLLLVVAILGWMRPGKDDYAPLIDEYEKNRKLSAEVIAMQQLQIDALYGRFRRDSLIADSFRNIRVNHPQVFMEEAAQKTDGASVDSLVNALEQGVQ